MIPVFIFTSLISPTVNKHSETFLHQEIAVKINKLIFIVRSEKQKSCIQSSSLDVCPGSALHLLLGFHVITRGWFLRLRAQTGVSLSQNPQRIQNLISEAQVLRHYSKYFNIKAERKENLSRGLKMWEQNCFDLNKTKFTERLGIFLSTLTLYYQPRCPSLVTTAFQLHLTHI